MNEEKKPALVQSSGCMEIDRIGIHREIKESMELRPEIAKPLFHAVLSAAPEDKIDDLKWGNIVNDYMEGMGFKNCDYVAVRHFDKEHDHVHVVASRIRMDNKLVDNSFSIVRSHKMAHELEKVRLTPDPTPTF